MLFLFFGLALVSFCTFILIWVHDIPLNIVWVLLSVLGFSFGWALF
jgi:hypothetical protein